MAGPFDIYIQGKSQANAAPSGPFDQYIANKMPRPSIQQQYASLQDSGALPGGSKASELVDPNPPLWYQQVLNGPIKGITQAVGFPGAVVDAATSISPAKAIVGGIKTLLNQYPNSPGARMMQPGSPGDRMSNFLADAVDAPREILRSALPYTIGDRNTAGNLQQVARDAGFLPQDPNWQPPEGLPKILDTANEYAYGTLPSLIASGGMAAPAVFNRSAATAAELAGLEGGEAVSTSMPKYPTPPPVRSGPMVPIGSSPSPIADAVGSGLAPITGGVGAGIVRNSANPNDPSEPMNELIAATIGAGIPAVSMNLARGAGVGPTFKAAPDPITELPQKDFRFFGIGDDAAQANGAFVNELFPAKERTMPNGQKKVTGGGGYQAARQARGKALGESDAAQKIRSSVTPTEVGRDADGNPIMSRGQAVSNAIENLNNAGDLATGGYYPTGGSVSGNTGLIGMESGASKGDQLGNQLKDRYHTNQMAISSSAQKELSPKLAPGYGQPEDAQNFVKGGLQKKADVAASNLKASQSSADVAKSDLQNQMEEMSAAAQEKMIQSSSRAATGIKKGNEAAKKGTKELYDKVDPNTPVKLENLRSAILEIKKQIGPTTKAHPAIADFEENYGKKSLGGKFGSVDIPNEPKTFGEMQIARDDLNDYLRSVDRGSKAEMHLLNMKSAIDADMEQSAKSNTALKAASAQYKKDSKLFREEEPGKVVFGQTDAGKTIDSFMDDPKSDAPKRLSALIKHGTIDESDVRDWFVGKVAENGKPTPQNIQRVLNNHAEFLKEFPDIKVELESTRGGLMKKSRNVSQLLEDVKLKQEELNAATENQTKGVLGQFASKEHKSFMDANLFGSDGYKKLEPLINEAKKDPTGRAIEGLKNSIDSAILRRITNSGRAVTSENTVGASSVENRPISVSKTENAFGKEDAPSREVMQKLFTPKEIKARDQFRKQMEVETRRDRKSTSRSNTAEDIIGAKGALKEMSGRGAIPFLRHASYFHDIADLPLTSDRATQMAKTIVTANLQPKTLIKYLDALPPKLVDKIKLSLPAKINRLIEFESNSEKQNQD